MNNYLHGKWGLQPVRHCCKGSQIERERPAFIFREKTNETTKRIL